jgi:hypothetical protein
MYILLFHIPYVNTSLESLHPLSYAWMMTESIEVRWFFETEPLVLKSLFQRSFEAPPRTDWYAFPCDNRSGIKIREGKLETKLRVEELGLRRFGEAEGRIERWKKWSVVFPHEDIPPDHVLASAGWIAVHKVRSLKVFRVEESTVSEIKDFQSNWPENGALFEYTKIQSNGAQWATSGLEAFGASESLFGNLLSVAEAVFPQLPDCSALTGNNSSAYPAWLEYI